MSDSGPSNLQLLARQFGEDQWREVIRLFLAMAPLSLFNEFMSEVVNAGRLEGQPQYTAVCLREAQQPGESAFLAALRDPKQRYPALQALHVLRDLNPEAIRQVAGSLIEEPQRYFGADELEPAERDLAVRLWQPARPPRAAADGPLVFVSYSSRDRAVVDHVCRRLERSGLRVWLDAKQVSAGDVIAKKIEDGVAGCTFFVPVLSRAAAASRWIDFETNLAWQREIEDGGLKIVPLLLEGDIRELPLRYRSRHVVDLRHDVDAGIDALLARLLPGGEDHGRTRINAMDGTRLVLIPGGKFQAGDKGEGDNRPRQIDVAAFYLAVTPVTNRQYQEFVRATGARQPESWTDEKFYQPEQPVVDVSWHDAKGYCQWAGLRLPTEWEWEKGARGTDGRRYPWGNDDPTLELANFAMKVGQPTPVGSYPKGASPYGLLDMAGNVWEWTDSLYQRKGKHRVVRGGSFDFVAQNLRAAFRLHDHPGDRIVDVGFRCAQDP
jgi:formylglycine-generating enzyme required for sulfatase activity